ncbi:MAG: DNA polymerase III subunit delta [Clostridia bacterium]|nr:DNA polymerase III subunit delta [Clostridia bacterium]
MTWQQLFEAIGNKSAGGVYLFQGPEEFVKRSAIDKLKESLLPEGLEALNETTLEGVDAQTIIENAETLPVMCDKRLVIVRDWQFLLPPKKKETGAKEQSKEKNESPDPERLEKWLPQAPESAVVVFYMRGEADKRQKAYKALEKYANVVSFPLLTDAEIVKWVNGRLKPLGKTMKAASVSRLIFTAGRELTKLSGEVDKLAAFAGDRREITEDDINGAVTPSIEANVFHMIDFLMAKKAKEAYGILNAMLDAGESSVGILALIIRQMRLLTHVKLLRDERLTLPEIEKRTGLSNYVCKKAYTQCANYSAKTLKQGYELSVDYDYSVKNGLVRDRAALDAMLLHLYSLS